MTHHNQNNYSTSKPLRQRRNQTCTFDPVTGQMQPVSEHIEADFLDTHGSINSDGMNVIHFLGCGCSSPPAGRCYFCGCVSCSTCHGQCDHCHVPLCLAHSFFNVITDDNRARLCQTCNETYKRNQMQRKVISFFIKPFQR